MQSGEVVHDSDAEGSGGAVSAGARLVRRGVAAIVAGMFAVVFVTFVAKIVLRYAFGDAAAWADEVSIVSFIWIVFLANAFVVPERRQIAFDLLYRNVPAGWRRALEIARNLLIGGIFAAAMPAVVDYTLFLWRERTPVLGWRLDAVYACFAVFLAAMIVRMAWRIVLLLRASSDGSERRQGGAAP